MKHKNHPGDHQDEPWAFLGKEGKPVAFECKLCKRIRWLSKKTLNQLFHEASQR